MRTNFSDTRCVDLHTAKVSSDRWSAAAASAGVNKCEMLGWGTAGTAMDFLAMVRAPHKKGSGLSKATPLQRNATTTRRTSHRFPGVTSTRKFLLQKFLDWILDSKRTSVHIRFWTCHPVANRSLDGLPRSTSLRSPRYFVIRSRCG